MVFCSKTLQVLAFAESCRPNTESSKHCVVIQVMVFVTSVQTVEFRTDSVHVISLNKCIRIRSTHSTLLQRLAGV